MMNIDVPDVEMDEVYEEGEREEFPPQEFEAEEDDGGGVGAVNSSDDEGGEPKEKKIKSKSAAKKIVKNPQAKLDDMRLCGQRGLPLLPKTFRDVKFKGKGHEVEDLDLYLSKMEHWAHRMFPKMVFDEVIDRCDRLYKTKKLVKTTLIRMRNNDNLLDDDEEGDRDDVAREGDDVAREGDDVAREGDDDDVRREMDDAVDDDDFPTDADIMSTNTFVASSQPPPAPAAPSVQITDEVRERIERNKRLAMEKRLARLQAQREQEAQEAADVEAPAPTIATSTSVESPSPDAGATATSIPSVIPAPSPATTVLSSVSGSVHSMPAVVSKTSALTTVVPLRKEGTVFEEESTVIAKDVTDGLADTVAVDTSAPISQSERASQGSALIDEAASNETELEEDELLKLINE